MSKPLPLEERVYRHLLLLQANDAFMADVLALREKANEILEIIETGDGGFPLRHGDCSKFDTDIQKLREKYKLSNRYQSPLKWLVKSKHNRVFRELLESQPLLPRLISEIDEEMDETGRSPEISYSDISHVVALEIFPETTTKDILRDWDKIAKERDRLYGIQNRQRERVRKSDNLERDLEMLKLKREGKTGMKIRNAINSDARFQNHINYEEVPKIIKRLKERARRAIPL